MDWHNGKIEGGGGGGRGGRNREESL